MAVIECVQKVHDFGIVKLGEDRFHTFVIKNVGNADLVLEFVTGQCQCTEPLDWSRKPIPPGKTSEIKIKFNEKYDLGPKKSGLDIIANTDPIVTELKITANMIK
jgi:Protein of unknown function (DUF1573)